MFNKLEESKNLNIEQALEKVAQKSELIEQINDYTVEIDQLIVQRKKVTSRIKVADMTKEIRYNKLKQESKKLKNAILMIAYRAETALYNTLNEFYPCNKKDGCMILKEIFLSDADLIPDYANNKLTVRLHSMSTPRFNTVVQKLCELMNDPQSI